MPKLNFKEPEWLQRVHAPHWVVLILAIVFVLRIPSFFEPFYYGDEMIYLNLGEGIKKGLTLYKDIHDNKPPLLYFMAAIAGNVFWFRAILALWMMLTIVIFWRLTDTLFKNKWIVKTAVVTFAILTTLPLLEGQIANAELFMIGPTIGAFYVLLTKKLNFVNLIFAGVLFSISALFKVPALFDIGAIIFFWLITIKFRKKEFGSFVKQSFFLALGYLVPILATLVWYYYRRAFGEYFVAAFSQNIGYLSSWRPGEVEKSFIEKNGPLLVRGGILLSGLTLLFFFRKKLSGPFVFTVCWLLFSLFAATLSERPYPHYLIQVVPAFSILVGMLVAKQSIEQSLSLLPMFLVVLAIVRFQFWYYPSFSYYKNFISFATGQISQEEYFKKFDVNTPRNYKIAEFVASSSSEDDKLFVWGDSPTLYALSHRLPPIKYVATYHINDFSTQEEVMKSLSATPPKFVIVLPESAAFPLLNSFLKSNYLLIDGIEDAEIWKIEQYRLPGIK